MRYWQCSKCKKLKETDDVYSITDIKCLTKINKELCNRRMRPLSKDQYDHEIIQRNYVSNAGPAPSGTAEMIKING